MSYTIKYNLRTIHQATRKPTGLDMPKGKLWYNKNGTLYVRTTDNKNDQFGYQYMAQHQTEFRRGYDDTSLNNRLSDLTPTLNLFGTSIDDIAANPGPETYADAPVGAIWEDENIGSLFFKQGAEKLLSVHPSAPNQVAHYSSYGSEPSLVNKRRTYKGILDLEDPRFQWVKVNVPGSDFNAFYGVSFKALHDNLVKTFNHA